MNFYPINPIAFIYSIFRYKQLILSLTRQQIVGCYKGSLLGVLWSFFNPVFMLTVYTFVFSVVFKARWGVGVGDSKAEFALILFSGLVVFNLFADCLLRSPGLIIGNNSYVKKIVFPLEILPLVTFGAALFNAIISFVVWLVFSFFIFGVPPLTALLLPLIFVPLFLLIMGLSWFLASIGVYLRDTSQVIGIVVTALMFLTPIFYPISAIPEVYHVYIYLNPLTFIVEQLRNLLIFGEGLYWPGYFLLTTLSTLIAWLGFAWFQKTRKGFADVL
jgi:lipopolysaccharide transport system permease protein